MPDTNLSLSPDELALLRRLVESAFGDARVEVHRTHHNPAFREQVKQEESVLRGLLEKLQHPSPVTTMGS